jgi:hypothetical protein
MGSLGIRGNRRLWWLWTTGIAGGRKEGVSIFWVDSRCYDWYERECTSQRVEDEGRPRNG